MTHIQRPERSFDRGLDRRRRAGSGSSAALHSRGAGAELEESVGRSVSQRQVKKLVAMLQLGLWVALGGCATGAASVAPDAPQAPAAQASEAPAPAAPVAATGPATPAVDWSGMSSRARRQYMEQTFEPAMKALFLEFDAARFASFGCHTCHGDNADAVSFKMPNGLSPLAPSQAGAAGEVDTPMARFMTDRVTKTLGRLLGDAAGETAAAGEQPCFRCHAVKVE